MSEAPLIVGVAGSRRDGSYTRQAIEGALAAAADAGAETDLIDLRTVDLPPYDPDRDDAEQGEAVDLLARVRAADGVIAGSPVYHGSYSSAFKNFHDYCGFDEYEDTVVGLVVVAGGGTIASTLDHMRITFRSVHAHVVPDQVGIRKASQKFGGGELQDADLAERLEDVAHAVVADARLRSGKCDPPAAVPEDDQRADADD